MAVGKLAFGAKMRCIERNEEKLKKARRRACKRINTITLHPMSGRMVVAFILLQALINGCKTKGDLKREQEFERLRTDLSAVRTEKADIEVINEELRTEILKLTHVIEQNQNQQRLQNEETKKEFSTLAMRLQALEQRAVNEELQHVEQPEKEPKQAASFENAKKHYDDGKPDEAVEMLRSLAKGRTKTDEGKKAQFFIGEILFATKDYATAALEFSEFKKHFPNDSLVPTAIYRQANAFRHLGKSKEAKLFYQELIDKYPKNTLAQKAKTELKRLK